MTELEKPVRPRWVLLAGEARARHFKSTLVFRRWCRTHGVLVRKTEKREWVRPADIDAVLDAQDAGVVDAAATPANDDAAAAFDPASVLKDGGR